MATELHPIIEAAGLEGTLPGWAVCRPGRRAHSARVADLLADWAERLGLDEADRIRWSAAGHLHDALKDAAVNDLVPLADPGWPGPLVHAPACAGLLREDGVRDDELLLAIAYHSTGHPEFGDLGKYLYMADFLEPGRKFLAGERAALRSRLPDDRDPVLCEVIRHRVSRLMAHGSVVLPASLDLWNRLVEA